MVTTTAELKAPSPLLARRVGRFSVVTTTAELKVVWQSASVAR